jgi:hypothetical protein
MRPLDCQTCSAAANRSAELLVAFRKAAAKLHAALGHSSSTFFSCAEPICVAHAATADHRHRPTYSDGDHR